MDEDGGTSTMSDRPALKRKTSTAQNLVLVSAALLLSAAAPSATSFAPTSRPSAAGHILEDTRSSSRRAHGGPRTTDGITGLGTCRRRTRCSPSTAARSGFPDQSRWGYGTRSVALDATREKEGERKRDRVRRRVRSVLAKARDRTGIPNNSDGRPLETSQRQQIKKITTASSVVAEAASIGGLGAVVVDDKGTIDVALDYAQTEKAPADATSASRAASVSAKVGDRGQSVSPASTYSPSATPVLKLNPEDDLVPAAKKSQTEAKPGTAFSEVDAFRGDVSAAFSLPPEPLPFTLPTLTSTQAEQLSNGERVQYQDDMGREGSGFVVMDVRAPPDVVWDCLLDFHSYPETIPTVRDVIMYTNTHLTDDYRHEKPVSYEDGTFAMLKHGVPSVTRAAFTLSKFRLKIAAIHKYRPHPQGDYMVFTLDPACTNLVLRSAKGVWHTQANPDGKGKEYTRVWLLCEVKVSRALPSWITDYAARRAMPRATTWLKPQVEAAASLWLKEPKGEESVS